MRLSGRLAAARLSSSAVDCGLLGLPCIDLLYRHGSTRGQQRRWNGRSSGSVQLSGRQHSISSNSLVLDAAGDDETNVSWAAARPELGA